MKKIRPVNLSILSIRFPIMAIVSILHRLSGVFLFLCIPVLLWLLHTSLAAEAGFNQVVHIFSVGWVKGLIWFVLVGLFGHTIAGIRHLFMDIGVGETLLAGRISAWLVIVVSVLFAFAAGIFLW